MHQVAGSDRDYYNNVTAEGENAPDEEGNLGEEGLGDKWEEEDPSCKTVQQEYEGDYQEKRCQGCAATPHTIRRFPECPIVNIGALSVGAPPAEADGDRNVTEIGVRNKYQARQFICRLWVNDKRGNKHIATCLCDNGSEEDLQSEKSLPNECVDTSPEPGTLEGVSGHATPGGSIGSFLKAHMVTQDLWEGGKGEDVVLEDYRRLLRPRDSPPLHVAEGPAEDARQGLPAPRPRPPARDPGPPSTEVGRPLAPPSRPLVAALPPSTHLPTLRGM